MVQDPCVTIDHVHHKMYQVHCKWQPGTTYMDHPECGWDHGPGLLPQGVRGVIQHVPGHLFQNMFYTSFGLVFQGDHESDHRIVKFCL